MQTLDDIRARGEADLQKLLADLDARHRKILLDAIAKYGNVHDVPESIWRTIEDDLRNKAAAVLLLLVADSDDWTADQIARQGVRTNALTTEQMSAYAIAAAGHADEMATGATTALRNRLTRKVQDSQLTGPGGIGQLTEDGIAQAIDDVLTSGRRTTIAVDQATAAISRGQIGARDRALDEDGLATMGGDGAVAGIGQRVSIRLIWNTHPELTKTGPCPRCAPLDNQPEEVWSLVFPEGPGRDAHENCACSLRVQVVAAPAGDDEA